MSTYILMRILESTPSRYDLGIRIITLGRLGPIYDRLSSHIREGDRVLDVGCGTGALTLRAAQRGARVKGIDVNSQMLAIARKRVIEGDVAQRIELCEMGVAELETEEAERYDAVTSGLCFSELSGHELTYALKQIARVLKPGGFLLVADEVRPKNILRGVIHWLTRLPLVIITYLLTQTTTRPVDNLEQRLEEADLSIESLRLSKMGGFVEMVGRKSHEETR